MKIVSAISVLGILHAIIATETILKDVYVIIGSEGGFSKTEVEKIKNCGGKSISLGKRILRVETASIVVLTLLQHEFGDI